MVEHKLLPRIYLEYERYMQPASSLVSACNLIGIYSATRDGAYQLTGVSTLRI